MGSHKGLLIICPDVALLAAAICRCEPPSLPLWPSLHSHA